MLFLETDYTESTYYNCRRIVTNEKTLQNQSGPTEEEFVLVAYYRFLSTVQN
jgi:hypothetical protein